MKGGFRARQAYWIAFVMKAWPPPDERRRMIAQAVMEKRIWLSAAVNLMAFGTHHVPDGLESVYAQPHEAANRLKV